MTKEGEARSKGTARYKNFFKEGEKKGLARLVLKPARYVLVGGAIFLFILIAIMGVKSWSDEEEVKTVTHRGEGPLIRSLDVSPLSWRGFAVPEGWEANWPDPPEAMRVRISFEDGTIEVATDGPLPEDDPTLFSKKDAAFVEFLSLGGRFVLEPVTWRRCNKNDKSLRPCY